MKPETEQRCNGLKGCFPFRLGATSYIVPDDLVPNVAYLADKVDDVELVLFESHEISNLPEPEEIETLASLADDHDLTYTVHLPLDADLGSGDETVRQRSVEKCQKVIRLTKTLDPFAYVIHLYGRRPGQEPADDVMSWKAALNQSIEQLLYDGPAPGTFCIETLGYPFDLVWDLVQSHDLSVCLDVGHIILSGFDLVEYLNTYLSRCCVVHLHGIYDGRDHCDIGGLSNHILKLMVSRLRITAAEKQRVLTLEIFNQDDFERSLDVLRGFV
ncbi:MAG: sugar phosphate isomerase/epimerase [Sedimentisphaerales bacterium]|nr:sugar phosphate isomerase/epimerase [Sedimentisphaerales bacterium]